MHWHPCFAYAFQCDERDAQPQEKPQEGNHAQDNRRRIAALRRLAGPPALVAISASVATRRRLFPATSSANVRDDEVDILGGRSPWHGFPSKSKVPSAPVRSIPYVARNTTEHATIPSKYITFAGEIQVGKTRHRRLPAAFHFEH